MENVQPVQLPLRGSPVLAYALGCIVETEFEDGLDVSANCNDDFVDVELETVDISARVGEGVNKPVSSVFSVSLDAVYDLGMTAYATSPVTDRGSKTRF